jgi:peptidyl-prolyl cis-trans isomerase D
MLQSIRERAQGWIAWAIVILISIPFALWGIQSYLGVGSEPVVAIVNGVEITQRQLDMRYQETRMRMRERLGAAYRPELFDEKTMRAQVLDDMIQENLLLQVSHDLGLRASDQELRTAIFSNPAFQKDGRFDKDTYDRMLELQGTRGIQFEEGLRRRIVGTQLQRALAASELVTDTEIAEAVRIDRQQRRVNFVRLPKSRFMSDEPISEGDIRAYYDQHQDRYQSPERVKLSYLVLDAESIGAAQTPNEDEEELRRIYEEEAERFTQPEQRRARHILVTLDANADGQTEADAKARIDEVRSRILAGEDFAALAKELSEDPGSASQGGDLGLFGRGIMDPAFEQAVFSAEQGQLGEPVRSQFGYHLIEVTEIEKGSVKPFEEVRGELAAEAAKSSSEGLFFDFAERLANFAYENPDSLEPAAEALGIELKTSDWIDRRGGEGVLANPRVAAAAFSDEVLREGMNSDLIEPEPDVLQAVVVRVIEHEEEAPKSLDSVREDIVASIRDERAAQAAKAAADEMLVRVEAGEALSVASGEDLEVTDAGLVDRSSGQLPPEVRTLAFTLPRPEASGVASFGVSALVNGDAALVSVIEVIDGAVDQLNEAERTQAKGELERMISTSNYERMLADMESRADVERKPISEDSGF